MTTASQLSQRKRRQLGADFQSRLQALDLQQKELAEKLGVHETTVYRWCAGDVPIPQYALAFLEIWSEGAPRNTRKESA